MRIVLLGNRSFSRAVFHRLTADDHEVKWWGREEDAGELAGWLSRKTPLYDLIVCAHSHFYVSRLARLATRYGALSYHPSLLPLHRGRDAVRWTLKMGDRVTGGTVFWLNDNVDGGPVARQRFVFCRPGDTPSTLWRRDLFPLGVELLSEVCDEVSRGVVTEVDQDEALATWEPSWEREPLFRPDLPQLGNPEGYTVVKQRVGW